MDSAHIVAIWLLVNSVVSSDVQQATLGLWHSRIKRLCPPLICDNGSYNDSDVKLRRQKVPRVKATLTDDHVLRMMKLMLLRRKLHLPF